MSFAQKELKKAMRTAQSQANREKAVSSETIKEENERIDLFKHLVTLRPNKIKTPLNKFGQRGDAERGMFVYQLTNELSPESAQQFMRRYLADVDKQRQRRKLPRMTSEFLDEFMKEETLGKSHAVDIRNRFRKIYLTVSQMEDEDAGQYVRAELQDLAGKTVATNKVPLNNLLAILRSPREFKSAMKMYILEPEGSSLTKVVEKYFSDSDARDDLPGAYTGDDVALAQQAEMEEEEFIENLELEEEIGRGTKRGEIRFLDLDEYDMVKDPDTVWRIYVKKDCPYSRDALALLRKRREDNAEFLVVGDRNEIPARYAEARRENEHETWPTIFHNDEFVGGYDDLLEFVKDLPVHRQVTNIIDRDIILPSFGLINEENYKILESDDEETRKKKQEDLLKAREGAMLISDELLEMGEKIVRVEPEIKESSEDIDPFCYNINVRAPWVGNNYQRVAYTWIYTNTPGYTMPGKAIKYRGLTFRHPNRLFYELMCNRRSHAVKQKGHNLYAYTMANNKPIVFKVIYYITSPLSDASDIVSESDFKKLPPNAVDRKLQVVVQDEKVFDKKRNYMEKMTADVNRHIRDIEAMKVSDEVRDMGRYFLEQGFEDTMSKNAGSEKFISDLEEEIYIRHHDTVKDYLAEMARIIVFLKGFPNSVFRQRVSNWQYKPEVLLDLTLEEKLPEVFANPIDDTVEVEEALRSEPMGVVGVGGKSKSKFGEFVDMKIFFENYVDEYGTGQGSVEAAAERLGRDVDRDEARNFRKIVRKILKEKDITDLDFYETIPMPPKPREIAINYGMYGPSRAKSLIDRFVKDFVRSRAVFIYNLLHPATTISVPMMPGSFWFPLNHRKDCKLSDDLAGNPAPDMGNVHQRSRTIQYMLGNTVYCFPIDYLNYQFGQGKMSFEADGVEHKFPQRFVDQVLRMKEGFEYHEEQIDGDEEEKEEDLIPDLLDYILEEVEKLEGEMVDNIRDEIPEKDFEKPRAKKASEFCEYCNIAIEGSRGYRTIIRDDGEDKIIAYCSTNCFEQEDEMEVQTDDGEESEPEEPEFSISTKVSLNLPGGGSMMGNIQDVLPGHTAIIDNKDLVIAELVDLDVSDELKKKLQSKLAIEGMGRDDLEKLLDKISARTVKEKIPSIKWKYVWAIFSSIPSDNIREILSGKYLTMYNDGELGDYLLKEEGKGENYVAGVLENVSDFDIISAAKKLEDQTLREFVDLVVPDNLRRTLYESTSTVSSRTDAESAAESAELDRDEQELLREMEEAVNNLPEETQDESERSSEKSSERSTGSSVST